MKMREQMVHLLNSRMEKLGMHASDVAKLTGVTLRTVNKWRSGETFSIDAVEDALEKIGSKVKVVIVFSEPVPAKDPVPDPNPGSDLEQGIYQWREGNSTTNSASEATEKVKENNK